MGFVGKGDILVRCPDDVSWFLSVVRFGNEIGCLLAVFALPTVVSN